jgi:hypothetical protein
VTLMSGELRFKTSSGSLAQLPAQDRTKKRVLHEKGYDPVAMNHAESLNDSVTAIPMLMTSRANVSAALA